MVSLRRKGERAARSAERGSDILGRTLPRVSDETETAKARSVFVLDSVRVTQVPVTWT